MKLILTSKLEIPNDLNSKNEYIICPSFVHLSKVKGLIRETPFIKLGAQNCSQFENGTYTGEVSAEQLRSIGVEYVALGYRENNTELINQKAKIALKYNLVPIICCNGDANDVSKKLQESLKDISQNILIAYEGPITKVIIQIVQNYTNSPIVQIQLS